MGKVKPHILAIPYPAQGHVIPLMEFSLRLAKHGFKVTFVNTEYNHKRVVSALAEKKHLENQIHLVSIPDGMDLSEDRNELGKLSEAILRVMPGKLKELIEDINRLKGDNITCVIADFSMGWALDVAEKMKIQRAAFWPASSAVLALILRIPKLIDSGIINNDGTPMENQMIQLAQDMPAMSSKNFIWACIGDLTSQKIIFELIVRNNSSVKVADWLICNSDYDLEPAAFRMTPEIIPIGPLLASNRGQNPTGNFWQADKTCLEWLDQQPRHSVIYVAFGSFTIFDQTQFRELALGLELSNRPFLWVVRPDITEGTSDAYPVGFLDRVASRGRMVGWAPQQKVLSHPSIACFLSHCGWNSTIESVCNGIPFLCWPYFADQFHNESYICDVWKVGLKFDRDESGIITQGEINKKVKELLGDENFKLRALNLQEKVTNSVKEGGFSYKNLNRFIEWLKA
ncbi:UDP-glycosyltransferase 83A1-like [Juglans microcarpa x Juglans regia]|uniref:UDP-glycosyltransferase 83A1-like n=1 Tax=Juglans microcarpa x Juglans regia TaxID=2249226 RepID=UPI001B7E6F0C|nr:UDP-glycosyltransferase 83A1-like [Juglans microcarpa x Juglans regia]